MKTRLSTYLAGVFCLFLAILLWPEVSRNAMAADKTDAKTSTKILLIAGPCNHPPGTHEAAAGARLLEHCLGNASNVSAVEADVHDKWPDASVLNGAATIVFIGDQFPGETMPQSDKIKADLAKMMERGSGIVCIHFATGLRTQHVAKDGSHPLLNWLGGYYSSGCPHHRSIARVCTATVVPAQGEHPVLRGWKQFTFDDEPYWNIYFGKDGMAKNVVPLATSMLPPENPKREVIAWGVQRKDGGRGVGVVLPHYFKSWLIDDLRTFILNGICWTAKLDIPTEGVQSRLPELSTFKPTSVDPRPRPKKKRKR